MKLFWLILFAILMCFMVFYSFKKNKGVIYKLMWIAYATSAIFCVLCKIFQKDLVGLGIAQNKWYDLTDTTLWGYLLIIICCIIAFKPFDLFNKGSSLENFGKTKGAKQFYIIFSYIYLAFTIIFVLLSLSTVISLFKVDNFGDLRISLYGNSDNESNFIMTTNFVANLCYKLCLQFKFLSIFVAFAMLKEKVYPKLAIILLASSFLIYYLYATGNAARGGLLIFCFCIFLIGTCFYNYFSKRNKKKIILISIIILSLVTSFFIMVTVSRFGNDQGGGNPILRNVCFYLGHGPIEFSKITGSLQNFAYGETIIGRLGNHYFGLPYSWESIQMQIGYPSLGPVFTTFLGYLYTDFGSLGCIIFVSLWSTFMCRLLRRSPNRISTIFIFLYYLSYFVTGIFAIGRLEYASFITTHFLFISIRLIEDLLKSKYKKRAYNYLE